MARVLFIDDDPLTLETYSTIIGYFGHDILLASTAEQAIQVAESEQPDMMFVDMHLPDMHGFDLLRHLHQNAGTSHIPAVMISAEPEIFAENAVKSGAQEFRSKPILPDDLLALIERYTLPPNA